MGASERGIWFIQSHPVSSCMTFIIFSVYFVDYNWRNIIHIWEAPSMSVSTENFTSPEVHPSANLTTYEDLLLNGFRAGLLCFNLLFGVPTHSYVLWLIARGRRIPSEFLGFNLTVCDLIYSLIVLFYPLKIFEHLEEVHRFLQGLGVTGRSSVSVSDLCWALPGSGSSCNLSEVQTSQI